MNTEYISKEDKLIVTDEYGHKTERNITNNFKEILITENNIEEMENLLIDEKIDKNYNNSNIKLNSIHVLSLTTLWIIVSIFNFLAGNLVAGCVALFSSGIWTCGFIAIIPNLKKLKVNKKTISILQESLTEEKNNLKELNEEKENSLAFLNQLSGTISTSEKIENLKTKLLIIQMYEQHKRKIIKLYKLGKLENSYFRLFYGNDFKILEELIKNDLQNENQEKKEIQKTLKLEKKDINY